MNTTIHTIFSTLSTLTWVAVSAVILLMVITAIPQLPLPELSYRAYVTTSGSMEPTINTGDLIFIRRQANYSAGDIVTFTDADQRTITHRITGSTADGAQFLTQGDNNEDPDTTHLSPQQILGQYAFRLPYVGYLLVYGQTPLGLLLLIGLPVLVLSLETTVFAQQKKPNSSDVSSTSG